MPWNDRFLRDLVPLQICRSVIESVLGETSQSPPRRKQKISSDEPVSFVSSARDVVWLPELGRWLPGSWADADISDKAVKSDNSPVDFRPWHSRIKLVIPCETRTLEVLERLAMRKWRVNVCRSLFAYMVHKYGADWQRDAISGSKRRIADRPARPSKRGRMELGKASGTINGGDYKYQYQITMPSLCDAIFPRVWPFWARSGVQHGGTGHSDPPLSFGAGTDRNRSLPLATACISTSCPLSLAHGE